MMKNKNISKNLPTEMSTTFQLVVVPLKNVKKHNIFLMSKWLILYLNKLTYLRRNLKYKVKKYKQYFRYHFNLIFK